MAKALYKLSARRVQTLGPGFHADGCNLYLRVKESGAKSWVFRYQDAGRVREIGLGPLHTRSLAQARELARAMREAVSKGQDPALLVRVQAADPEIKTFADWARELIEAKRPGWKNAKHAQQWQHTLRDYAFPLIGHLAPVDIELAHVKAILSPIWATKTETASRLRQRIEAVLDYAAVHGACDASRNPARWKGNLDKVLPPPRKVSKPEHFAALPYAEMPRVMAALAEREGIAALCLRFIILTACRSGEARGCTWDEIDFEAKTWTIPARRMKADRPHRVPLSDAALAILHQAKPWQREGLPFVFPGPRGMLSDVAVAKALHAVAPGVTVHGMRSSFRTWAEEQTNHPRSVTEAALAHAVRDQTEAAYQRSDLIERRRALMRAWARLCVNRPKVLHLRRA